MMKVSQIIYRKLPHYTSLDLEAQSRLQASIDYILGGFDEKNDEGIYTLQGASVCIDNTTGMVRAIVGGRSQDDVEGYTLNRAFQSFRQPGSAIKPLIVYTPALERGYTPDTIVVDEPIENGPVNGDGTYSGAMTLRQAVALSKNTIAWKVFEEITPEVGISYLESMQFSNLDANDKRLPASVGGFTNGYPRWKWQRDMQRSKMMAATAIRLVSSRSRMRMDRCSIRQTRPPVSFIKKTPAVR